MLTLKLKSMRKLIVFMAFLIFTGFQASAQMEISGKVTNKATGDPIPGVSVVVKSQTTIGTATDMNGNYTLSGVPSDAETLVFSFVGMETMEVSIDGRTTINVAMEQAEFGLEEVVVTGYGTTRKKEFTGSISSVQSEKLEEIPMPSVDQVLQGNVAGLQSAQVSGTPGSNQQIRIRGIGSINADNNPLVVVDGVPVVSGDYSRISTSGNVLSTLNPNDIADVNVLKDAGATAIYGARGANGVIVITTKSGSKGKTKFNFNAEYGYNDQAVTGPESLNAEEWNELQVESIENAFGVSDPSLVGLPVWDGETDTDWHEAIMRDQARQQKYNLSARGGTDRTNFYLSGSYYEQQGKVDATGFDRVSGMAKLKHLPHDNVTINTSVKASFSEQKTVYQGGSFRNPMMARYFLLPIDPVYDDNGDYWWNPSTNRMTNSLFNVPYVQEHDFQKTKNTKVMGNTRLEWRPVKGLKLTSKMALDYLNIEEPMYWNPIHGDGNSYNGIAWAYFTRNFNWVWQNMADYGFNFADDHRLDLKLVYEAQKNKYYSISAEAERVASMGLSNLSTFASPQASSSFGEDWTSSSAMLNARYGFTDKYFFEGTYRREGHSRFSDENKYGNFWSVGGSWVVSNESFMQGIALINTLKLRASYGVNGNAGLPGERLYLARFAYSQSYDDYPVISYTGLENQDLTWEVTNKSNVGLDFEMLDKRLNGTVEYYIRTTEDMLLALPLSRTSGHNSLWANVGAMQNKGFEVSLSTVNIDGNGKESFRWTTDLNFSQVKNEVTELAEGIDEIIDGTKRVFVGNHVKTYYLRKWAGVDPENGDPLWYINGEGGETTNNYSEAQRADQGNSLPDWTGGLTNTISWKGVSLSFQFNVSLGYKVYDSWAGYMLSDGRNYWFYNNYKKALDRWQEPGDQTDVPKNIAGGNKQSYQTSTRYLYDGDHIRLRNLTLSYDLPESVIKNLNMDRVNIFVRGTNMWTYMFDEDLKWDPETDVQGIVDMEVPILKTYTVGAKLSF
jgi:TonB-linked SusC/RagA family outer membrane protein